MLAEPLLPAVIVSPLVLPKVKVPLLTLKADLLGVAAAVGVADADGVAVGRGKGQRWPSLTVWAPGTVFTGG